MANVLPAVRPERALYGLVNPKTLVSESGRWLAGFEQESVACEADVTLIDMCNPGIDTKVIDGSPMGSTGETTPFTVQAQVNCSTMGGTRINWEQRALDALEMCQDKAIELEFWEGRLARAANADDPGSNPNKFLANGDAVDLTPTAGTPVRPRYGLALLEGSLASSGCGSRGFIHVSPAVGSVLPIKDANDDGILTTTLGNYVVTGTGYTGTGTNGAQPSGSAQWIYATGPVFVRLDEPHVNGDYPQQMINTRDNSIAVRAERAAAVTWDGCAHFKVLVDLSLDYA